MVRNVNLSTSTPHLPGALATPTATGDGGQGHVDAAVAGEGHLEQRSEQAAVGAVVARGDEPVVQQGLTEGRGVVWCGSIAGRKMVWE